MTRLRTLAVAALASGLVLAVPLVATGGEARQHGHQRDHTWQHAKLKLEQRHTLLHAIIEHDVWVIETAKQHTARAVRFHRHELRHARAKLKQVHAKLYGSTAGGSYGVPGWFVQQALCVHSHEGAWNSQGYFYGGMQFLLSTWAAHGGLRFGSNPAAASPMQQIAVAYQTWKDDGGSWQEWPTTARMCGLL